VSFEGSEVGSLAGLKPFMALDKSSLDSQPWRLFSSPELANERIVMYSTGFGLLTGDLVRVYMVVVDAACR